MVGGWTPGQEAVQYPFFVNLLLLSTSVAHQASESPSMVVQVLCQRPAVELSRKGKMQLGQSFLLLDVELSTRSPKRSTKGVDPSFTGEGIKTDTRQAGRETSRRR